MKNKKFSNKNVVVTGGAGFIGKALVKRLVELGANVLIIDSSKNVNICNMNELKKTKGLKKIDLLYHLAAMNFVPYSWSHPHEVYNNNILSTLNILDLCRIRSIKKLVYMSSYVYGAPKYLPVDERHPISPHSPYSWSKFIGEDFCRAYSKNYSLKCAILRPVNVYGPGQNPLFLIPSLVRQFNNGDIIRVNSLKPKRDFLFIDDVIEALIAVGRYEFKASEIFNIGFGKSYSVSEVIDELQAVFKKRVKVVSANLRRKGEIMDVVADISKAKRILKWEPRVSLKSGLEKIRDSLNV